MCIFFGESVYKCIFDNTPFTQMYTHEHDIQDIIEGISDGFLILDKDWNIKWCNAAFEHVVGINKVKTLYNNFRGLSQGIDGLDISGHVKMAMDTQSSMKHEVYLPAKKSWYTLTIYPSEHIISISFQNITHAKEHHENVLIDERNLRILIDIMNQPVWLVDPACNILLCNEAFKTWITYFIGTSLDKGDNVLAPELSKTYIDKFKMCYELALNGKTFNTVEDMMVDGEMKFATISFNPVFDSDNKLTAISCHASDITDQRKSLTHLDAQSQLLMEIANIQSHKVRGPVATLLGLVKVFDFEDMSNPDNAEVVQGIASVTESLDGIVKDVIRNINKLNKHTKKLR